MRLPGPLAALLAAIALTASNPLRAEDPPWTAGPEGGPKWTPAVQQTLPETLPVSKPVAPAAQPTPKPPQKLTTAAKPAPPPVTVPEPPSTTAPVPSYTPQPVTQAAAPALETWPGVAPPAVQTRRGVVGSPNLTLSRDYSVLDLFGAGLFGEDARTAVVGQPAAPQRSFVSAEYLLWWVHAADIPALATTASGQATGFLGVAGTETLLGPGTFGSTTRSGFRLRAGTLLGESGQAGIDAGFFFLGRRTTDFHADSGTFPTIARPFFAPNFNQEFAELVAFPGLSTGAIDVRATSSLWGADVNTRCVLCCDCDRRSEVFAGYRHLNLREELAITETITASSNAPDPVGTAIVVQDSFRTRNQFHGGQLGYTFSRRYGRVEFDGRLSVALGVTHQDLDIAGFQSRTRPGQGAENFTGGLLAAGPNLGSFGRDRFSVAPEATFNVGLRLTDRLKVFTGYNFLYWSNVIRPGDQIDRTVDLSFVPNGPRVPLSANRPLPTFKQTDFWAQGLQFGVEYRW